MPYFDKEKLNYYNKLNKERFGMSETILPYEISKGCINKCLFCMAFSKLRIKRIEKVISELTFLSKEYKSRWVFFTDNTINASIEYLEELCNCLIENKLEIQWYANARPQFSDVTLIKKMRRAGCRALVYGIESGSQTVLDRLGKGKISVKEMSRALKSGHNAGIVNFIFLIMNYIYESEEEFKQTIEFIERNHKYIFSVAFMPFVLVNDSQLHSAPQKYGIEIIRQNSGLPFFLRSFDNLPFNETRGLKWLQRDEVQLRKEKILTNILKKHKIKSGLHLEPPFPLVAQEYHENYTN